MAQPWQTSGIVKDGVVYVVDDDNAVREGLDSLIRSVGLTARTFTSARDFLGASLSRRAGMSGAGRQNAGAQRS